MKLLAIYALQSQSAAKRLWEKLNHITNRTAPAETYLDKKFASILFCITATDKCGLHYRIRKTKK